MADNKCEQSDLRSIKSVFNKLMTMTKRAQRNTWLHNNINTLPGETWNKYRTARTAEIFHVEHVRMVMTDLTHKGNCHDWSKDEYYFFTTISYFTFGEKELLQSEFTTEVNRHYELEPHHPEYEKLTGCKLTEEDVREMAIDRLSRNFQKNNGQSNMEQMKKFEPKFVSDQEANLKLYWKYVEEYTELVKTTYNQLCPGVAAE